MFFHLHTFMIEQCVCMCVLIIIHIALIFCPTCFMHFDFNAYVVGQLSWRTRHRVPAVAALDKSLSMV